MLRRIAASDVPAAFVLAAGCPEAAQWSREEYERACDGAFDGWVAALGENLVGFLIARRMAEEMEILNLAVEPGFRRRGVASRLLEAALACGRESGARRAFLEVRASNAGAIAFYAAWEFFPAGRRPRYYADPPEDALVLSRELT